MPLDLIAADFFTRQHRIKGQVSTGSRRLTDFLNDELHSSLELTEVEVARVAEPEKVIFTYPSAVLMKEAIVFAMVEVEGDRGESRIFKYVEKRPYEVILTLPPYEIAGVLYLRGTGDLRTLLVREVGHFVPMTRVQIVYTPFPAIKFSAAVAIVNRNLLEVVGERGP